MKTNALSRRSPTPSCHPYIPSCLQKLVHGCILNSRITWFFAHTIMLPRDPQSGQPSGQRVHKALKITKVIDKSSPLLFRALTAGERLPKVEMKFYRTSAAGTMEHYFTIALEDAIIVDITSYMPNCQDPSQEHFTHLEDVSFTYRKIIKTHEIASTSESDDWRAMSTQA